jgi:glycosyltransferase involved in cell wall biosynthesis
VAQCTTKEFMAMGHECGVISAGPPGPNGSSVSHIPSTFKPLLKKRFKKADFAWSYTIPANWKIRFGHPSDYKAAMYAYESSVLPKKTPQTPHWPDDWGNMYKYVDKVLVPSNYVKDIFEQNGTPDHKIAVVPHGIDHSVFDPNVPEYKLNTKKKFKFLAVASNLWRKNIQQLLKVYTRTFTKDDDVCLVIKTSKKNPREQGLWLYDIEPDLNACLAKPNCPEIITIFGVMKSVAPIYKACDCYINISASEGFGIILLEAMAYGLITMAPEYGGVLDFINKDNSLLIDCDEIRIDPRYQYWHYDNSAVACQVRDDDLKDKMIYAYKNKDALVERLSVGMKKTVQKYTWKRSAEIMLEKCGK